MISNKTLGTRIKYFRKRAGLSQLELETEIGASPGMMSRIEKGVVNPTKETLLKIVHSLDLNEKEIDYTSGKSQTPLNQKEIDNALESIQDFLQKENVFAYIRDDRWNLVGISRGFLKFLCKIYKEEEADIRKELVGKTIIELFIDKDSKFRDLFDEKDFEALLRAQLKKYHSDVGFMEDDKSFQGSLKVINSDQIVKDTWQEISTGKDSLPDMSSRDIVLKIKGIRVPMNYSKESLYRHPRLTLVEYKPKAFILKKLLALL